MGKTEWRMSVLGLGVFALSCLYLPVEEWQDGPYGWAPRGWTWIVNFSGDRLPLRVDMSRLVLEWLALAALLAIARLTMPSGKPEP